MDNDRFVARELKHIPFSHPDLIMEDVIFLDADILVYQDAFGPIFEQLEKTGGVACYFHIDPADRVRRIVSSNNVYEYTVGEEARQAGYDIENVYLHSAVAAKGSGACGIFFAQTLKYWLDAKPFPSPPEGIIYYNDEFSFAATYRLTEKRFPKECRPLQELLPAFIPG